MSLFSIVPVEVIQDDRLSGAETKVLVCLLSFRNKNTNLICPGIAAIAARLQWKDETRVSKITTSLVKKGWLTKKKRGFNGANEYEVIVPMLDQSDEQNTNEYQHQSDQLGQIDQVGDNDQAQFGQNDQVQFGRNDQVQFGQSDQANRQDNKQSNRQDNNKKNSTKKSVVDFSVLGVSPSQVDEVIRIRSKNAKSKKTSEFSQRMVTALAKQFQLAVAKGYSIDEVLDIWESRAWLSFEAEWLTDKHNHIQTQSKCRGAYENYHTTHATSGGFDDEDDFTADPEFQRELCNALASQSSPA